MESLTGGPSAHDTSGKIFQNSTSRDIIRSWNKNAQVGLHTPKSMKDRSAPHTSPSLNRADRIKSVRAREESNAKLNTPTPHPKIDKGKVSARTIERTKENFSHRYDKIGTIANSDDEKVFDNSDVSPPPKMKPLLPENKGKGKPSLLTGVQASASS